MADPILSKNSTFGFIGLEEKRIGIQGDGENLQNGPINLFNLVGDADSSGTALRIIQTVEKQIKPQHCFNRPENVFRTSRGSLPETLANIPGCRVPRVKEENPASFAELKVACETFDAWPLIIRARGYHGGEYMKILMDDSQLEALGDDPWLYNGIFLIEFIDYRNNENLYWKTRVILVDGTPYPRHSITSDKWLIHAGSRADLMNDDIDLCRQEERFLAWLRDEGLEEYGAVFSAIQERVGLDLFGIDFALVDGQVLVFEANACMNFIGQSYEKNDRRLYLEGYMKSLKRAVKNMLMTL